MVSDLCGISTFIYHTSSRLSSSQDSRKRPRLAESFMSRETASSTPEKVDGDLLEAWWEASRSSSLVVGGVPSLPQFDGMQDRNQKAGKGPGLRPIRAKQGGRNRSNRKRAYVSPSISAISTLELKISILDPLFLAVASLPNRS